MLNVCVCLTSLLKTSHIWLVFLSLFYCSCCCCKDPILSHFCGVECEKDRSLKILMFLVGTRLLSLFFFTPFFLLLLLKIKDLLIAWRDFFLPLQPPPNTSRRRIISSSFDTYTRLLLVRACECCPDFLSVCVWGALQVASSPAFFFFSDFFSLFFLVGAKSRLRGMWGTCPCEAWRRKRKKVLNSPYHSKAIYTLCKINFAAWQERLGFLSFSLFW